VCYLLIAEGECTTISGTIIVTLTPTILKLPGTQQVSTWETSEDIFFQISSSILAPYRTVYILVDLYEPLLLVRPICPFEGDAYENLRLVISRVRNKLKIITFNFSYIFFDCWY
jgi:hypothetical protein